MFTDECLMESDRFAFVPRRLHAFETTGNAYDATQSDERIASGHTLVILSERVVGVAHTWPFAVTAQAGHLHSLSSKQGDSLAAIVRSFLLQEEDLLFAMSMAAALGFELDPVFAAFARPSATPFT